MSDTWLYVLAAILVFAVPFDLIVAGIFIGVAMIRPRIGLLVLLAFALTICAAVAGTFGLLGMQSIVFNLTAGEVRIFPAPIPTILLAVAGVGVSVPAIVALVWLVVRERRVLADDSP